MNTRTKGLLATMISAVFFGFIPLFVKTICAGGGNSVSAAFYRFFLSVPVLYIYLKAQGISMRITRTEFAKIALITIFGYGGTAVLLFSSYNFIPSGMSTTIHFMYPVFTILGCMIFFKEKVSPLKLLCVALCFGGILLFYNGESGGSVLGMALSGDVQVEMFLQQQKAKNSSSPTPDVLALRGMSIAWINEAEDGQKFALAKLKKLTGGGFITARGLMDKQMTSWLQTHLPIMTTNELPKAKADDAAFWSRAHIVKWGLSFVDDPQQPWERQADKNLDEKIQAEAKGVLVRMVQGAMEYLRDGLKVPQEVKDWTKAQRETWDDIGQFFTECCQQETHQNNPAKYALRVAASDLHEAFCIWYAENKDKRYSISAKSFAQLLNKKDIDVVRSNGTWRLGIDLKPEWKDRIAQRRAEEEAKKKRNLSGNVR